MIQAASAGAEPLAQLVYRSAAVGRPTAGDLDHLLAQARERNAAEDLTGLLVYDQGRFVQWLEGPNTGIDRVWQSIRRDPRHTEVERLHTPWHPHRLFPNWQMQFGVAAGPQGHPEGLPMAGMALRGLRTASDTAADFMDSVAVWRALPPTGQMVAALTSPDDEPASRLTDQVLRLEPSVTALGLHVLSPLAQALGDAWRDDRCDTTALLIAQGRLQVLMRSAIAARPRAPRLNDHRALVTVLPGETHLAGLTFASVALDAIGWSVECGFPRTTAELERLVSEEAFDVLHIALSDSFTRDEKLGQLAATIRAARRASRVPQMQVLVSGRAFAETPGLAVVVGADGDGLAQGSEAADIESMLSWARIRSGSSAMMVAQAMINGVALAVQRKKFGLPDEPPGGPAAKPPAPSGE